MRSRWDVLQWLAVAIMDPLADMTCGRRLLAFGDHPKAVELAGQVFIELGAQALIFISAGLCFDVKSILVVLNH